MSIELAPTILGAPVRRWKRYPAYRDSGVEWIGAVPEGWRFTRLKYTLKEKLKYGANESAELDDTNLPRYIRITDFGDNGKLKNDTFKSLPFEVAKDYILQHGDVLFARSGATVGKTFQFKNYDGLACFAGYLIKATPNQKIILSDYLYFLTKSNMYDNWKNNTFIQATIQNIGADKYSLLPMFLPNIDEQRAIAAFLDRETGRIDTLIEKKERQVELLQEKRAALISHVVTKGLDPDVKMKDSGVEWLGEVPEDWKLKRIKQIASKIGSGKTPKGGSEVYSESGVTFLRSQNIHFDGLRLNDVVFIKESIDEVMFSTRVFSNDVLLNITGASLGRCSLVPDNFTPANVNQHVCIVRPIKKSIVPLFLYNVFASKVVQAQIFSWENGSSREGLTFPQIANLVIVAPDDLEEQHSIAAFLDRETERIDTLTTKVHESISKLREYRTALISAAVTGKIDVRSEET